MNYGPASKYYDLFTSNDDINFYKELAQESGSEALDVGIGTGRVAIELARAGVKVWGIDSSKHMLRAARNKLKNQPKLRKHVILKLADIRVFKMKRKFPFAYIAGSTFEHCIAKTDQEECLAHIYDALENKGLLAFDVSQVDPSKPDHSWWIDRKETGTASEVVRTIFSRRDARTNVVSVNLFFDVYHNGVLKERYFELGQARISTRNEIETILNSTGFKELLVYGDFDRSKHTERSQKIVFVARKL